jgi:DNA invertase Pin-like site-specific DNA recombinase
MIRRPRSTIVDVDAPHSAVYLRVSSASQQLASQEPDLQRWMRSHEGSVSLYTDKHTGTTMQRPGWDRLWAEVLRSRVARIVVWRLDRLGRTASGLTALFDELVERKVGLVSLRDGFDLTTAAGRLMAGVLASVAQYETEVRGERQAAGIAAAKAQGVFLGRKPGTLKAVPARAAELRANGLTVPEISAAMAVSQRTVARYLGSTSSLAR